MRHVTDGELHAYLDGGLDAFPDDRATEVRRHVDRCETCASRLEEARTIRTRADEILAVGAPDVTGTPSLEELKRLAAAPAPAATARDGDEMAASTGSPRAARRATSGGPLGGSSLRWAATVLVALGAGWLWGIAGGPGEAPAGAAPADRAASSATPTFEQVREPAVADRASGARASSGTSRTEATEPDLADRTVAPEIERDRVRVDSVAQGVAASRPTPDRAVGDDERTLPAAGEDLRRRASEPTLVRAREEILHADPQASDEPSLGERLALGWVPLAGSRAPAGVVAPDSVTALRSTQRAGGEEYEASPIVPGWPSLDSSERARRPVTEVLGLRREVAGGLAGARMRADRDRPTPVEVPERARRAAEPSIDPGSLTVPGLEVVSVEWTRVAPETTGIRVVQRLVTGGTIELRFGGLDDGTPPPEYLREERLPEELRQVIVDFRKGWLVARAPLEPEQIRALVALIR